MKKITITIASLAILGFATIAGAQEMSVGFTYVNDLTIGSSNPEVSILQTFLISQGYNIPAISANVVPKGYFGGQTKAAVMSYQAANGIPSTGYVGPLTRARLNLGKPVVSLPQVVSPNGGEVLKQGTSHLITWKGMPSSPSQTGEIWLQPYVPPCAEATNSVSCMIAVPAPYLVSKYTYLGSGTYSWLVGKILSGSTASASSLAGVPDGQYKITVCFATGSLCDSSDSYFQITSGTVSNTVPVITGVDAPTTLTVGQNGTWTVRASDPQNSTLSYSVDWGDTLQCPAGYSCALNAGAPAMLSQQSTTFTHSYATAGTYKVWFTVRNSAGLSTQTSTKVNVTGGSQAGALRITSPNGGEVLQKGATYNITWTSPNYFRATYADLKLVPYYQPCTGQVCPMGAQTSGSQSSMMYPYMAPYAIASNISINQNLYSWNVGYMGPLTCPAGYSCQANVLPDGQYTIQICETGTNNCDSSDAPFSITSKYIQPHIEVSQPDGGEIWNSLSTQVIRWSISGNSNTNAKVDLYLDQANIYCVTAPCGSAYVLDRNISASTEYYWIVATDINNVTISAGVYKVRICFAGSMTNCDSSDSAFTITSACPAGYVCRYNPVPVPASCPEGILCL